MNKIKGFCEFNDLIKNTFKETCSIGELSPIARTFTRHLQTFTAAAGQSDFAMHVHSYRDDQNSIITTEINPAVLAIILPIMDWIFINSRNGVITTDPVIFNQLINEEFGTPDLLINATTMFTDTINSLTLIVPTFVTIEDMVNQVTTKIWFVNGRFEEEYDDYELVVVPPVEPIDQLTLSISEVAPLIDAVTIAVYNQNIRVKSEGLPYTAIATTDLTWHQLSDNTKTLETTWTTIVYGPKGENIEIIRDNLTNYILANSAHPEEDWMIIYPDLFIKDEFTLVPLYDKVAIGAYLSLEEIFQPHVLLTGLLTAYKKFYPEYPDAHYSANACFTPTLWQSIAYLSCGGQRNNLVGPTLVTVFPDYILAQAGSADFDRMSERTRNFVTLIERMLVEANRWVYGTVLPTDMGTITRGGLTYITSTIDSITYLVLSRTSFTNA